MGFVFGVEGTIGTAPFHFYRFQWDQGGLGNGMFINEISQTGTINLYSDPGNFWTRGFNHNFSIVYKSTYIEVYVDGNFKTKILGCMKGTCKITGDIISPIDVEWNAEKGIL